MQVTQKYFSFAEVVQGRDASVRVSEDGLLYAVDLVMVMSGKNREDSAKAIRDLPTQLFQPERFSCRQPEKGGHPTKLLTFQDALELVMVLPGRVAKQTRTQFANIINRYLAGNHSMISENRLEKNDYQRIKKHGFVYMIESEAFPNFVKIGRAQNLEQRLDQINFAIPIMQYHLVACFETEDCVYSENQAQKHFYTYHHSREFFVMNSEEKAEAIKYFTEQQKKYV